MKISINQSPSDSGRQCITEKESSNACVQKMRRGTGNTGEILREMREPACFRKRGATGGVSGGDGVGSATRNADGICCRAAVLGRTALPAWGVSAGRHEGLS